MECACTPNRTKLKIGRGGKMFECRHPETCSGREPLTTYMRRTASSPLVPGVASGGSKYHGPHRTVTQ